MAVLGPAPGANPDRTDSPCNFTIRKFLAAADITSKQLVLVPVARNTPEAIDARCDYSRIAMGWDRDTLIFIDETTFSKGKHRSRERNVRGALANQVKRNSPGPGVKVCAAVSPVVGLVMFETQLTAYSGDTFAEFMAELCAHPFVQQQSRRFVVDNVYVHFVPKVYDVLAAQSVQHTLQRLPTYSPHLNPIEYCFHNWKTEIRHINQLTDRRSLIQQVDDTRTCIDAHLVTRILDHVYQLYMHCIEKKPLEEFKPIGHRTARSQVEAQLQRDVIAAGAEEEAQGVSTDMTLYHTSINFTNQPLTYTKQTLTLITQPLTPTNNTAVTCRCSTAGVCCHLPVVDEVGEVIETIE